MVKLHCYSEHYHDRLDDSLLLTPQRIIFKDRRDEDANCLEIYDDRGLKKLKLSYYIGVDWLDDNNAIYVEPKINTENRKIDYLTMLSSCLRHPDVLAETENLYHIQFEKHHIQIKQQQDLLTPLLIVHFLQLTRVIVKKGLKKGYYPVEQNLNGRIKGKILKSKNVKVNIFKNQSLKSMCTYEEFGLDILENRLLKKTLRFIQRYSAFHPTLEGTVANSLRYCLPAFDFVSKEIEINELKTVKVNPLFKEYSVACKLAKLILKRFGYNINSINNDQHVSLPPFWIDMSRLFELFVLGKLKDRFKNNVTYQFARRWNELDYLVNSSEFKIIIDAKYKLRYDHTYDIKDIRQVSGYGRLKAVADVLNKQDNETIDCLIIYPNQLGCSDLPKDLLSDPIKGFSRFFKLGIKLPSHISDLKDA